MSWQAQAPSNIALIKYMGKADSDKNIPCNASLSYTLNHLTSTVELTKIDAAEDCWQGLPGDQDFQLSEAAQEKYLKHFQRIKKYFGRTDICFMVRSRNNFPADCGLASSASSSAALTKAACSAMIELNNTELLDIIVQAQLSQLGSGSSCRSFYEPWCLWEKHTVKPINLGYTHLHHQVIVVSQSKKTVSSSSAHQKVCSSLLFEERPRRAQQRCEQLIYALTEQQWQHAYEICWQEFWDMHALFETATPPFGYMTEASLSVLNQLRALWQQQQDGPIITMDAGPNIHLLYRPNQLALAQQLAKDFSQNYLVLSSYE